MQRSAHPIRRLRQPLVLALALVLGSAPPVLAGPEEKGWTRLEEVPAWVTATPEREGWLRAVDAHVVERLDEAYEPGMVFHEWLGIYARIEWALRPILGGEAKKAALAGARAARVVHMGYFEPSFELGIPTTAFLLWETPMARVLPSVPAEHRAAAKKALLASRGRPTWQVVRSEPAWVTTLPDERDRFFVAVPATSVRPDVARAVVECRYREYVRFEIAQRLEFYVGAALAHDTVDRVLPLGRIDEAAWRKEPATAWLLWSVSIEPVLEAVPATSRKAALQALGEPPPPDARDWQWVESEPTWAKRPHAWPQCIPFVQVRVAEEPFEAQQEAEEAGEEAVRTFLRAKLRTVRHTAAEAAVEAGVGYRASCARAAREREVEPTRKNPDGAEVTTWILWQIPLDRILDAVDPAARASVRQALIP